jgi:hypothetical protein
MNPALYIAIFMPIFMSLVVQANVRKQVAAVLLAKKRGNEMKVLFAQNIGKKCRMVIVGGASVKGVIKSLTENAVEILISPKHGSEYYNIDLVSNLRILD